MNGERGERDGILSLIVEDAPKKNAGTKWTPSWAVLHPHDIQALGVCMGDWVIVSRQECVATAIVWASDAQNCGYIHLDVLSRDACGAELGSTVTVEAVRGVHPATRVQLSCVSPKGLQGRSAEGFVHYALRGCCIVEGQYVRVSVYGQAHKFRVECINDASTGAWQVVRSTQILLGSTGNRTDNTSEDRTVTFASVGGLMAQVREMQDVLRISLHSPETFERYGITPVKGVLLFGPPGTGKTLVARAIANECHGKFFLINGPEMVSKFYGESEATLRNIFHEAAERAPSVIFIDEIDALCPRRDEMVGELEKRLVSTLLTLMDGVVRRKRVLVVGATNRPNRLDPAMRRPGRLDREIEIGIPSETDRQHILLILLQRVPHDLTPENISALAARCHGYVGADLAVLCKEGCLHALRRFQPAKIDVPPTPLDFSNLRVLLEDMQAALGLVRPSAMREIAVEVPRVQWTDIGGQEDVKQKLKEAVEWPLKHPDAFLRMGIRPPKGILLYGPPGCSKTMMAKALATEGGLNFLAVKGPELFSKWVGESEKAVQELFRKARAAAPSIVFFDEIDAIAGERSGGGEGSEGSTVSDRVLSQLLNELDGIEPLKNVIILAATNRPDIIDKALLRPGRIDRILFVGAPSLEARREILRINMRRMPCSSQVDLDFLSAQTRGYSGAEVASVCREAALCAMQDDLDAQQVLPQHFARALEIVRPRITQEMLRFYDSFRNSSRLASL